jgi:dipeptidase D
MYKAGTGKYKDATFPVILQSHMDMVCASSKPDMSTGDVFAKGVQPYYEDNNTKMRGRSAAMPEILTSLGADDGIGVAATCAILDDKELEHPPIVAVITVEEEDGMDGARVLTREEITGLAPTLDWNNAKLINIDDERDGIFSVSCAGTLRGTVVLPIKRSSNTPEDVSYFNLSISGLTGGHSGICIQENRANANILLCDVLQRLKYAGLNPLLISLGICGEASNAIPVKASAVIAVQKGEKETKFLKELPYIEKCLSEKHKLTDPGLKLETGTPKEKDIKKPYETSTFSSLLNIVRLLPDGAFTWDVNKGMDDPLVETSSNLGVIKENENNVEILCMIRSSVDSVKAIVAQDMEAISKKFGAEFIQGANSPGWILKEKNELCELFLKKHDELFAPQKAKAGAIHAGLECGYFAEKLGDIDMIACGPQLNDVHTINETLHMNTVPKIMKLLIAVLESL